MSMSAISTGSRNDQPLVVQEIKYEFHREFVLPDGTRSRYLDEINLLAWHFDIRCESLGTLCRTCMGMSQLEPSARTCLRGVEILSTLGQEFGSPPVYLRIGNGHVAEGFFRYLHEMHTRDPDRLKSFAFWADAESLGRVRFHMERLVAGLGSFSFYPLRNELLPFFEEEQRQGRHWVIPGVHPSLLSFGGFKVSLPRRDENLAPREDGEAQAAENVR